MYHCENIKDYNYCSFVFVCFSLKMGHHSSIKCLQILSQTKSINNVIHYDKIDNLFITTPCRKAIHLYSSPFFVIIN